MSSIEETRIIFIKMKLYKHFVRPIVEYGGTVLEQHRKIEIQDFEKSSKSDSNL